MFCNDQTAAIQAATVFLRGTSATVTKLSKHEPEPELAASNRHPIPSDIRPAIKKVRQKRTF